jgi:proteasome lid subunit RPN8/RPN11
MAPDEKALCADVAKPAFRAGAAEKRWHDICRARGLTVVADIHTHPGGAWQSGSDRAHPIIARAGHLALIVPNFAAPPVKRDALCIYRYGGGGQWQTVPPAQRRQFFHIGL